MQYLASTASSVHPESESSEERQSFVTLGLEKIWIPACPLGGGGGGVGGSALKFCLPWTSLSLVDLFAHRVRENERLLAGRKINLSCTCTCPGQPDTTFFKLAVLTWWIPRDKLSRIISMLSLLKQLATSSRSLWWLMRVLAESTIYHA